MRLEIPACFCNEVDESVLWVIHFSDLWFDSIFKYVRREVLYLCCPATIAIWKLYLCDLETHTIARLKYCGEITLQGTFFSLLVRDLSRQSFFLLLFWVKFRYVPPSPVLFFSLLPTSFLAPFTFFFLFFFPFGVVLSEVSSTVRRKR